MLKNLKLKQEKNLILGGKTKDENEYTEQVYETYSAKYEDAERLRRLTIFIDILHPRKIFVLYSKILKRQTSKYVL